MYKSKRCNICGEIKLYDCEQCYGTSDKEDDSVEQRSNECLGQCSKDKKNKLKL